MKETRQGSMCRGKKKGYTDTILGKNVPQIKKVTKKKVAPTGKINLGSKVAIGGHWIEKKDRLKKVKLCQRR